MKALIAFVSSLVGGSLVIVDILGGVSRFSMSWLVLNGLELLLAVGAIFGGWLIYSGLGRRKMGAIITLVAGILILALTGALLLDAGLIILGGALGLVAAEVRSRWAVWQ